VALKSACHDIRTVEENVVYKVVLLTPYIHFPGPMIEIIREQMVYIAGSNLEVSCVYKNATSVPRNLASLNSDDTPQANEHVTKLLEATRLLNQPEVPDDTMIWFHNGLRFSHRNRRR